MRAFSRSAQRRACRAKGLLLLLSVVDRDRLSVLCNAEIDNDHGITHNFWCLV